MKPHELKDSVTVSSLQFVAGHIYRYLLGIKMKKALKLKHGSSFKRSRSPAPGVSKLIVQWCQN